MPPPTCRPPVSTSGPSSSALEANHTHTTTRRLVRPSAPHAEPSVWGVRDATSPKWLLMPMQHQFPLRHSPRFISAKVSNRDSVQVSIATQVPCLQPFCHSNPRIVEERIVAEVTAGRLLGPIAVEHLPMANHSPMGLVPKPHQPNSFRLIVDLLSPQC